jgi:hypothetical protein
MNKIKRINVLFPVDMYNRVKAIADSEGVSFIDVIRRFIRIGFLIDEAIKNNGKVLIRQDNVDREIVVIS